MTALYFGVALQHGLPRRRGMWALLLGFLAVAITVFIAERSLPALPFLGGAVLLAWPEARRLERGEWLTAICGVVAVLVGMYALSFR